MFLAFSLSLLSVYAVLSDSPHQTFTFAFTSLCRLHYRITTSEQSANAYTSLLGQARLEVSRNIVLVPCAYVCKVRAFFSPSPSLSPPPTTEVVWKNHLFCARFQFLPPFRPMDIFFFLSRFLYPPSFIPFHYQPCDGRLGFVMKAESVCLDHVFFFFICLNTL